MMPSRAFRSRSSATWSRSTAPARAAESQNSLSVPCIAASSVPWPHLMYSTVSTFIGAVIEDVEGLLGRWTPLLIAEDEVDPLMQVGGHIL